MTKKRWFTVKPKHWWQYLLPSFYRQRRVIYAVLDAQQEEINRLANQALMNALLFGTSMIPIKWDDNGKLRQVDDPETDQDRT